MGRLKQMRSEVRQALDFENRVFRHLERVIISGTVRSFYERQIAINSVRQVAGVVKLTDNITVVG